MTTRRDEVRLGYAIGSGEAVPIPIGHMVVTGQSQLAGKTTTLEALIARAKRPALAFVTKRGEGAFGDGRVVAPYFREQTDWRFVASILEATLSEKMRFERSWIMRASKGAKSLADVQRNVRRLMGKAKGLSADIYYQLDQYLDEIVPQIASVQWARRVELAPGLNVMDLAPLNEAMQHLVIRSSMLWVLEHATETVVVVPEAWKFAPEGRGAPVKLAAEAFVRQGAALGNYLWLDSQDITGVDKRILKQCSVWLLGVQREVNEIKRTLAQIPAATSRPNAEQIAMLELGQFIACYGRHMTPTYVQPAWMNAGLAAQVATGQLDVHTGQKIARTMAPRRAVTTPHSIPQEDADVKESEARQLREQNEQLARDNENLQRRFEQLEERARRAGDDAEVKRPRARADVAAAHSTNGALSDELWEAIRARMVKDPVVLKVVASRPALDVEVERQVIAVDGASLRGRIARLIADDWFSQARTTGDVIAELERRGYDGGRTANINVGTEMKALTGMGFFTRENKWFTLTPDALVNVVER